VPLKKGRAATMTHDYKRHGTTTLFAALDVKSGLVILAKERRALDALEAAKMSTKRQTQSTRPMAFNDIPSSQGLGKLARTQSVSGRMRSTRMSRLHLRSGPAFREYHGGATWGRRL
jgi:hypothetical protein